MHSFCKSTSKVTQKNHVLAGIEGKDLGPKFFLGIDLGVLEGQISGGLFSDSIFDTSVIGATVQPRVCDREGGTGREGGEGTIDIGRVCRARWRGVYGRCSGDGTGIEESQES